MPSSNAEYCRNYRIRKKTLANEGKKVIVKKTNAENCRMYRLRKKLLVQECLSPTNENLNTPSTLNLQWAFGPSSQPLTAESMSATENPEMQGNETHIPDVDIKNEDGDLTIHIKPETEYNEHMNTINDDDNPFQDIQVELKQEESVQQSNECYGDDIKTEIIPKYAKEMCHISDIKADEFDIKSERESSEIVVPDDYPSQDEGSMDSNEARALNNVEACLQDEVDVKVENYQVPNNAIDNVKDEMGYMVTETHLISNKLINTTSTVTIPCEGMIESETTKTLIMEIHPMLRTDGAMHKIGNPEVILPTAYHEASYEDFQLNSITSNIMPLEQEAYGLLQAKKKKCLNNQYQYTCPKCPKSYNSSYSLKKHLSVHDSIERRALGVIKGLQTKIERKSKNYYEKICKRSGKPKTKEKNQQIRKDRLEKRLQRIKKSEAEKSKSAESTNTPQDNIKIEIEVQGVTNENIKKEGYVCTCGQVFQRKSRMETCLRSHETYTDSNCYVCMSCSKQFKDKEELASHRKRLHRKRFPCKFCPTDYNTRKELFKHLQIHQEVQLTEYKVISQVVKGKQKLKCFMCKKAYSELSDLKSHVMEDHKQPYVCSHCNGTFSKIVDFCNHIKTHHPEVEGQPVLDVLEAFSKLVKAWKCEECELQFHEADKLAKHQVEQHSPEIKTEAQFQCPDCHRMFVSQKGLTSHARIHHSMENNEELEAAEQGVMCVECRKICKDMDSLTSHMRLHSPERKYPCKFCDFRFTTPEKRKAHSEIHTGDMKYVCFICEYQCSSENRLQQHKMSLKHANMKEFLLTGKPLIQEDPSTSKKKETSSKETEAKKRKKEKERLSSEDEEELMCDVCGDKFSSKKKMLKHKSTHPFIEFPNEDTPTRIFFK